VTIRIGIAGYGNLGRGVELAVAGSPDMKVTGVFTRRNPETVVAQLDSTRVFSWASLLEGRDDVDVLILCGGSKTDLPEQGPQLARIYNTVDSFDTHAQVPQYFSIVDDAAQAGGNVALIATGWDPGLFSINRVMAEAVVPTGATYTFWGRGLSQGHSDAVRRVAGVAGGVQYTIPAEDVLDAVRAGEQPKLSAAQRHRRECYVVLEPGADPDVVSAEIKNMPHYFADYDTEVHFISAEELARDHATMPHGGTVLRSGVTGSVEGTHLENSQVVEYTLKLGHNPQFTSSVLVAYARAVHRMAQAGEAGAKTVFDVAPGLISPKSPAELRRDYL